MELNAEINKVFGQEMAKLFATSISKEEMEAKAQKVWRELTATNHAWNKTTDSDLEEYIKKEFLNELHEEIKKILAEFDDKSFLNTAYDVAISHHEKWNGLGYPYGIKGEEIPLAGRIMAVADVFDALVAKRVYKQPMPIDKAVSIIIGDAGTHFDPDIIEVFKEVVDDFKKVALDE